MLNPDDKLECEWGSNFPIGIANVTMHDAEGNEIEIPKCSQCGNTMSCCIGKECQKWICYMGCEIGEKC